jgi:hypothetical protein
MAAQVLHVIRAVQHLQVGLLAKSLQCAGQRLRRHIEVEGLGLYLCSEGQGQGQGGAQQARLEHAAHHEGLGEGREVVSG